MPPTGDPSHHEIHHDDGRLGGVPSPPLPPSSSAGMMSTPISVVRSDDDPPPPSTNTRKKLIDAELGDGSFEALMRERTRIRKEKDEHSVAELRVQLSSMERALATEVRRRIASQTAVETRCAERVATMETEFNRILDERARLVTDRLSALESKVDELSTRFEEEKDRIPADVERRGRELSDLLKRFQDDLSAERRDRLQREGRLAKQIDDHERQATSRLDRERSEREAAMLELREKMERTEVERSEADGRYETLIRDELQSLRDMLERERSERKAEDDEIVGALNRYTDHLQSSLNVISTVDDPQGAALVVRRR